jgi:hypothetical protein
MEVGFMVMIQKQSNNRCSGRAHNHQEQKRCGRSGVQQRVCSVFVLFFSMWRGLFTVNLFLLTCWSTVTITRTVTFWGTWEKMGNAKDQNFGATTTGSFITTMHPPICPWKPEFVTNNNIVIIPHPLLLVGISPLWCHFVSHWKWNWRDNVLKHRSPSRGIASSTQQH